MPSLHESEQRKDRKQQERREFQSYVWGIALALVLTVLPFALVHARAMSRSALLVVFSVFALVQMIVHFRFFLHITFRRKREDLQLIVFSVVLLTIMVGGTIWIMASLGLRMAIRM